MARYWRDALDLAGYFSAPVMPRPITKRSLINRLSIVPIVNCLPVFCAWPREDGYATFFAAHCIFALKSGSEIPFYCSVFVHSQSLLLFVARLSRWPERLVMVLSAERSCCCLSTLVAGWRGASWRGGSRKEDLCFPAENSDDEHILYFMKHRTVADK
ncbi:hypothetical protein ACK37C_09505 [Aeromonas veronii]